MNSIARELFQFLKSATEQFIQSGWKTIALVEKTKYKANIFQNSYDFANNICAKRVV